MAACLVAAEGAASEDDAWLRVVRDVEAGLEAELEPPETTPPLPEAPLTVLGSSLQAANATIKAVAKSRRAAYSNRRITSPWSMSASFAGTTSSTLAVSGSPAPP